MTPCRQLVDAPWTCLWRQPISWQDQLYQISHCLELWCTWASAKTAWLTRAWTCCPEKARSHQVTSGYGRLQSLHEIKPSQIWQAGMLSSESEDRDYRLNLSFEDRATCVTAVPLPRRRRTYAHILYERYPPPLTYLMEPLPSVSSRSIIWAHGNSSWSDLSCNCNCK